MLVAMSLPEVESCVERVVRVFADALSRAKGWDAEEAEAKARAHIATRLPEDRAGHQFLNVIIDDAVVGCLWFEERLDHDPSQVYIFDIEIHEDQRGKGFGTVALGALEDKARELGADEIALAVFGDNTGAIRLNERLGYRPTETGAAGMQMAKRL